MSEPSTAVLDIDTIHVEDGFNPRTEFDPTSTESSLPALNNTASPRR
jgi:hypothetical protein